MRARLLEERLICRPVLGRNGGPFPRFSEGLVFKVKVLTLTLTLILTYSCLVFLCIVLSCFVLTCVIDFFSRSFLRVLRQYEDVLQLTPVVSCKTSLH